MGTPRGMVPMLQRPGVLLEEFWTSVDERWILYQQRYC